jgi:Fe2+ transport system protein FeoA
MIPFTQTAAGGEYIVCKIKGKLAERLELEAAGLFPGTRIKHIIGVNGFLVCQINSLRVTISRESARNLFVVEAEI